MSRPGGPIAICCWTPDGTVGDTFGAAAPLLPPPFASPPALWGTRARVQEMFAGSTAGFEFSEHSATIVWASLEEFADYFMDRFSVMVTAARLLGERFADLRAAVIEVWRERNEAADGSLVLPEQFLQSLIRCAD